METKVLVTGATGATGKNAIIKLVELNIPVRALVHKIDARSAELAALGVEIVEGDLSDLNSVSAALKGISAAYFVYPIQVPGLIEATAYFIQAALEENVGHIVNMSQRTARRNSPSHAAQNHWISERLFDQSGIPVTHLRPTLFAEWLSYFAGEIKGNNRLISPFTDIAYAPIAGEDTGRVIASILADPESFAGQTLELYGPEELTQEQVTEQLSEVLGRKITYIPMEIDAFGEVLKQYFTPYFVQHIGGVAQDFKSGISGGMNKHVEQITGQYPISIRDYIQKNIALFK
ncbi:NmrA family NAD(P)-binding protein [Pedobacter sp. ISL-68]|uniref:NmrA family NAD(P)-binding protein n=1 Tax=unclassified Pedobacter TaxID=2628915 RepID=UPI001BE5EFC3|nr:MULTISPECIES: NmrA family NAD(P)-binding protein [unclassified Pedobacter]MBT2560079.1 NmrA family NAD(P)-binding protein [Pedobacter sp. ISL-64]MBT2589058.1 NmrA family NAD(P)-binding protein [Pedobacter sp. ISL-68]